MVELTRSQKSHVVVHNAALAAAGVGAGWLAELVLIPDVVPLSILQILMIALLAGIFHLHLAHAVLVGLVGVFCTAVLGRGLSLLLFHRFPEEEVLINTLVAGLGTEALGWISFRVCRTMGRRLSDAPSGVWDAPQVILPGGTEVQLAGEPSFMTKVVSSTSRPFGRVLLCSAPMLIATAAALVVVNVSHLVEISLRSQGEGLTPARILYPLIARKEGLLEISGIPRGETRRLRFQVRNDVLAAELERHVLKEKDPPRVSVLARIPDKSPDLLIVGSAWEVALAKKSDYFQQVRGRLYLLVIGLLGSLVMIRLGERRAPGVSPSALARGGVPRFGKPEG